MRHTLTLLLAFCLGTAAALADGYRSLIVTFQDGTTSQINLTDGMQTKFTTTQVRFVDGATRVTFDKTTIASWRFDESVGIHSVQGSVAVPTLAGRTVRLSAVPAGTAVRVLTADGRTIVSETVTGNYEINLQGQPAGTYIIGIGQQAFKIHIK